MRQPRRGDGSLALSRYQRFAYRLFGSFVSQSAKSNVHLRLALLKAHIPLRPEVYLSFAYLNMAVGFVSSALVVGSLGVLAVLDVVFLPIRAFVLLALFPLILASSVYLITFVLPDVRASSRSRDIEIKLPYALNYIATMASAGITVDKIFASLANQNVYGEVANEAAWISRDLQVLGKDVLGALNVALDRSPSAKFQDFLQGAIITLTSGGELKDFFRAKADQYAYENVREQEKFLDGLGVISESYVTLVVGAPLFLLVLLSVLTLFGTNPSSALLIGYSFILILLPLTQLGFAVAIKSLAREP